MNKKISVMISVIVAALLLSGCSSRTPMPADHVVYQTGLSAKLGTAHRCVNYRRGHRHCNHH
ncbi:lipoprotein [Coxiella endosymbiont of Ornithodoros maritimus]|uniref:lipoprotein n=1 Tax=Coxiella endosymbiont of Ornithodoros maritimus TaxID=1656172 RepID=UPI002264888F|nr:lipoprotein [Coxiella endosymbiont of Ornithodoros maritimus]